MMSIEEVLRAAEVRTAPNGLSFASLPGAAADAPIERLVATVPQGVVPRLGRTVCYFVPWLIKQRRGVGVATEVAAEGESRKELCHHLDVKPAANLLLISLQFYQDDRYGLAMEFFDKIAYIAALEPASREDFYLLLAQQLERTPGGELTPEANEWRREAVKAREAGQPDAESELNYRRAAETDSLGIYMAALFTDVFFEDLSEDAGGPALPPEGLYERVRVLERLYPPNRGYSLQIVRQRARKNARA
ncbi:MAG: hypothetical protein ACRD2E_07975 [Terriglobales bacterium]